MTFNLKTWVTLLMLSTAMLFTQPAAAQAKSKYWKANPDAVCWLIADDTAGLSTDITNSNGQGYYVAYWCATEFSWRSQIFVSMHEYAPKLETTRLKQLLPLVQAKDKDAVAKFKEVANEMLKASSREPTGNYVAAYDALYEKGQKALDANRPADPVFRIGAETRSSDHTRPAFLVVAGVRQQPSASRAPSGVKCTCKQFVIKELNNWCTWEGGPADQVSLCEKEK